MPRRCILVLLLLFCAAVPSAFAQQAPNPSSLNETERLGQNLFYQSCGVCHTKPQITSAQFGPVLSRASAGGSADTMRATIENGTPRMPGFKYQFDSKQISAIVAYLRQLPEPPAPSPPAPGRGG